MINIRKDIIDESYRYKMPALESRIEGRGNGVKTVITNMNKIAEALETEPDIITKFFGFELGAQSKWEKKTLRSVVNGRFDTDDLQDLLYKFIDKFILCQGCFLPELDAKIDRHNRLEFSCRACGKSFYADSSNRLTGFIIKSLELKKQEERKKSKNLQAKKEQAKIDETKMEFQDVEVDENDWALDTSKAAEEMRLHTQLGLLRDPKKTNMKLLLFKFRDFLESQPSPQLISFKIKQVAKACSWNRTTRTLFACELFFSSNMLEQIPKTKEIFSRLMKHKRSQIVLLGYLERFCGEEHRNFIEFAPHILKALYDEDLIEEENILEWAEQTSSKFTSETVFKEIITKVQPVVDWLKNAESESEDDGEDDDGDDGDDDGEDNGEDNDDGDGDDDQN
ncbi:eukaryotic translation initiation factor 5 [Anaeramoeba ignava]|uniref:Eukaryotic translation initiation factor 5 n=1 Tax=Anaeramoeba ignava TaxID=1746090 RepID=A0A9Q0LJU5_ANAIG|nr:eukaryotic translation initiation factor 5 [Anaeramoeba ignava]